MTVELHVPVAGSDSSASGVHSGAYCGYQPSPQRKAAEMHLRPSPTDTIDPGISYLYSPKKTAARPNPDTVESCYKNTVGTEIKYSYRVLTLAASVIYYPGTCPWDRKFISL